MKKRVIVATILAASFAFSAAACTSNGVNPDDNGGVTPAEIQGKATLLKDAATPTLLSYTESTADSYRNFKDKVEEFASDFSAIAYEQYVSKGNTENFAVSPISIYLALGMLAETTAGQTRDQICSALNTTYAELSANYQFLYRDLNRTKEDFDGKPMSILDTQNSVWLDENVEFKSPCLENLANRYFCSTYNADFKNDNAAVNAAIQEYVKEATRGLINQNFDLDPKTVFALINALYLKDIWDYADGDDGDLNFTKETYNFKGLNGTESVKLLQGKYFAGRTYEDEKFKSFFTSTLNGYKIKFILPKDGYSVGEVFTAENIAKVNAITDYNAVDEENKIEYKTRCLFPEYTASYDENIISILREKFGITDVFNPDLADYSTISDDTLYCSKVQHVTKLEVDKKGIEGAAVTVLANAGSAPPVYQKVFEDFVVDESFGFIISVSGVTLFAGVVNNV